MALSAKDRQAIAAEVAALLRGDESENDGVQVEAPDTRKRTSRKGSQTKRDRNAKTTAARKGRTKTRGAKGCLTAGEAWTLLGSDPEFEPSDHSRPANGPQLWRLNAAGKLSVR